MGIEIISIVGLAALFVGFLLLRPIDGKGGCHRCVDAWGGPECGGGCDARAERNRKPSVRMGPDE